MHLWLIGMMGAGKTRVGRLVSELAGVEFRDTDDDVAASAGCSIDELWEARGEAAFRALEADVVARTAARAPTVVATGGGVVLDPRNVTVMRDTGLVVWLEASPETLVTRVGHGRGRPLLAAGDTLTLLREILAARHDAYARAAHRRVRTDDRDPETIAQEVYKAWIGS